MSGFLWSAAQAGETEQPTFGPAPAPLDGPELPSFRFPLGAQKTETFDGGTAKEATVTEFPVSEKLAGVYMTLEPGALARAALARQCRRMGLCDRRALPRHHHRSREPVRDRRFRSRRCLVFPARPRSLDPGARARHLHLRARVRQRLFLGVRHLLDHRLARPYAARRAGPEFRRCRPRPSPAFPRKRSISPTARCRRRLPQDPAPAR